MIYTHKNKKSIYTMSKKSLTLKNILERMIRIKFIRNIIFHILLNKLLNEYYCKFENQKIETNANHFRGFDFNDVKTFIQIVQHLKVSFILEKITRR